MVARFECRVALSCSKVAQIRFCQFISKQQLNPHPFQQSQEFPSGLPFKHFLVPELLTFNVCMGTSASNTATWELPVNVGCLWNTIRTVFIIATSIWVLESLSSLIGSLASRG